MLVGCLVLFGLHLVRQVYFNLFDLCWGWMLNVGLFAGVFVSYWVMCYYLCCWVDWFVYGFRLVCCAFVTLGFVWFLCGLLLMLRDGCLGVIGCCCLLRVLWLNCFTL